MGHPDRSRRTPFSLISTTTFTRERSLLLMALIFVWQYARTYNLSWIHKPISCSSKWQLVFRCSYSDAGMSIKIFIHMRGWTANNQEVKTRNFSCSWCEANCMPNLINPGVRLIFVEGVERLDRTVYRRRVHNGLLLEIYSDLVWYAIFSRLAAIRIIVWGHIGDPDVHARYSHRIEVGTVVRPHYDFVSHHAKTWWWL